MLRRLHRPARSRSPLCATPPSASRPRAAFPPELAKLRSLYDVPGLEDAVASLPVYRTYVEPRDGIVAPEDRAALRDVEPGLRRVLTLESPAMASSSCASSRPPAPVMAKGVEDTAFYRYAAPDRAQRGRQRSGPLLAGRRELPRAPTRDGRPLSRSACSPRRPTTPSAAATCVRACPRWRLCAALAHAVGEWRRVNASLRRGPGPDAEEEYLIYQTLVGAWPIEPGAPVRPPDEGASRGQAQQRLGRARRALGALRARVRERALRSRAVSLVV